MSSRLELGLAENPRYLSEQLITYIGNKRSLLDFIGKGLDLVRKRLNKNKIDAFDVFSGSGVVARYMKQYSNCLYANDLERYAAVINRCYLTNAQDFDAAAFGDIYKTVTAALEGGELAAGFIAELYAPKDDAAIGEGERVFYTARNAKYIDTARRLIDRVPKEFRPYLLAPLLSEASVHANTSGVFKGFYKNSETGIGQFGGKNQDALCRIRGNIAIPYPVFSNFQCDCRILSGDSNLVCQDVPEVDVAYLDPPYNQHPYGSNYFMLNLIVDYERPASYSAVSGIPGDWNRSQYNRAQRAYGELNALVEKLKAKFLIVSFNSEGFIPLEKMKKLLADHGKVTVLETTYNTFRGSRNLAQRDIHVKEYLYLLEKN